MTHYIIVKFNGSVTNKQELFHQIEVLFLPAAQIEGIHQVELFPSCIGRPNRHDLMIRMEMEPEALAAFDASEIHRAWKEQFGGYIAEKTIFDHM